MIRLEKFYDLISRNATVTLTNRQLDTTFFEGSMRDIPDHFSNCIVEDFCVSNTGDFLFKIKVNPGPRKRGKTPLARRQPTGPRQHLPLLVQAVRRRLRVRNRRRQDFQADA